ncbi:MAG: hypothetical protein K0R08_1390, partial [Solimicrobium sp.]|nr:hypothetical protein [Solimicrobium sp.]
MKTTKPTIFPLAALVLLASCGGHGGDSGPSTPPLEGMYVGNIGSNHVATLVLEDGSFWSTYSSTEDPNTLQGFSTGKANYKKSKFDLNFTHFEQPGDKPVTGTGSGDYNETSMTGVINREGKSGTFKVTVAPATTYIYKTPASLTSVYGLWEGKLLNNEEGSITVDSGGMYTGTSGTSSNKCDFTGKFTPRSKVNV